MIIIFVKHRNKKDYNDITTILTSNLSQQLENMRMRRRFLNTCASEAIVSMKEVQQGGLGLQFGFPGDPKTLQEKSKMKLWRNYFYGKYLLS